MAGNRTAATKVRPPSPKKPWKRRVKRILWSLAAMLLVAFITFSGYVWSVYNSLAPQVALLPRKRAELGLKPTVVVSADGVLLARLSNELREPITYPEIPKVIIDTTVAAEDKRFWEHRGVDFTAMARALWTNFRHGSVRQGGSTITQQIAKRLLTSGERSFRRKIEDACLAVQIEKQYTKEQILELYLNQVYYGSQAYGIKAAAQVYFGKPLDKLTLGQAALLARLPRRPSDQNPFVNPKVARANRDVVLDIMLEEGMITPAQHREARDEPLRLIGTKPILNQVGIRHAPYFTSWLLEELREQYPTEDFARGGYVIRTTLNMKAQEAAEAAVRNTIRQNSRRGVTEGALVVMTLDGQIKAMVGGSDFSKSQYNIITLGVRQPGSAFKPFVYSTAIDMGVLRANGQVSNQPFILRDRRTGRIVWQPKGGGTGGSVSIRTAIAKSINVPAVWACDEVGPANVVRFAHDVFGFKSPLYPGPALALGSSGVRPIEMAEGYSVFANHGSRATPFAVREIIGPEGPILNDYKGRVIANVLSPSTVEPMRDHLRAVVTSGTGHRARGVMNAAGKTGTTNDHKDAWFCGYTDSVVAIAWVANATYDPSKNPPYHYGKMNGVFGGEVAAAMWAAAVKPIQQLLGETKSSDKDDTPAEGVTVKVCTESNERARAGCPSTETKVLSQEEADALKRCELHGTEKPVEEPPQEPPTTEPPLPDQDPPIAGEPRSTPPPKPANNPKAEETVRVEVCVETALRATTYCRQKRLQSFRKGTEPLDYCHIHRP